MVEFPLSARQPLDGEQQRNEEQHDRCELCGATEVGALQPRRVDADSQCLNAEVLNRAEIVQAFHERQGDAGGQRRTSQRQGHRPECTERRAAKRARHFQHANGLLHEARPRRQVDVRI